jgi:hypothetical protein
MNKTKLPVKPWLITRRVQLDEERPIRSLEKGIAMKILTSTIVGTVLLIGSAFAAQTSKDTKPATGAAATAQTAPKTDQGKKKHHRHKKTTASSTAKPAVTAPPSSNK